MISCSCYFSTQIFFNYYTQMFFYCCLSLMLLSHNNPCLFPISMSSWLWASHEQVECEGHNEQEAERGWKRLVGCSGHENVLVFINADRVIRHWGCVDVVPRYGTWRKIKTGMLNRTTMWWCYILKILGRKNKQIAISIWSGVMSS